MSERFRTYLALIIAIGGLASAFMTYGHALQKKPFAVAALRTPASGE